MNEKNTSLVKTCNTTRKVVKVMRIICYVAIALFFFVAVVSATPLFQESGVVIEDSVTGSELEMSDVMIKGSFAVASLIIGSIIMHLCEKVLRTVNTESTPFVKDNVSRVKKIAVLMASLSVVPSWFSQIVGFICGSRELMMNVEIGKLALALVVWCIALIFEYGVTLQEREDETL